MNVKDLINALKDVPEDAELLVAKDEEGNGFYDMVTVNDLDNPKLKFTYNDKHIYVLFPSSPDIIDKIKTERIA